MVEMGRELQVTGMFSVGNCDSTRDFSFPSCSEAVVYGKCRQPWTMIHARKEKEIVTDRDEACRWCRVQVQGWLCRRLKYLVPAKK